MMFKKQIIDNINTVRYIINNNSSTYSSDLFFKVQSYMNRYPNDEDVSNFRNWFANYMIRPFMNDSFIRALNYDSRFKYGRYQEMFKYFPYSNINDNRIQYFNALANFPSQYYGNLYNLVKGIFWYGNAYSNFHFSKEQIDIINDFLDNNYAAFMGSRDAYDSFENETLRYREALSKNFYLDFREFRYNSIEKAWNLQKSITEEEVINNYVNKKLGNIGEIFLYNYLKNNPNNSPVIFTARDLGNGFGFDMYHRNTYDVIPAEYLTEVKTTANLSGTDYFSLSNNEFNKMIDCANLDYSSYYIARGFYDSAQKQNPYYYILEYNKDNATLYLNQDKNNVLYERADSDNGHKFVRYNSRVLTLKK